MKTLGVYTKDFSLYHDIIKALKTRKVAYVSLSSFDDLPRRIGVILTSQNELKEIRLSKKVAADAYDSIDYAIDLAVQKLTGKELYSKIYIGIDPGERPGVAIVCDDILIQKIQVDDPEHVASEIKRFVKFYPSKETFIRIGHGSMINRNRIINSLIPLKIPIEIVDETRTTPAQQKRRCVRNIEAAAAIALLSGGRVQSTLPIETSRGAIKNVQKRSRQLSEGRFSISEKTALQVLRGEISLLEAIEKERTTGPVPPNVKKMKKNHHFLEGNPHF
ncbi:MAG TPA: hypothetical protein DSN98_00735 [Thermoplasmata archaeon]|jgi:hypothetical protein|nr:MAG TPA: hypothetical protein DSN98_00735 [Thermoplasmata archaeon]